MFIDELHSDYNVKKSFSYKYYHCAGVNKS